VARDAEPTRAALVSAAERLFATEGIDRVSMREISRASGARNAVALQYHFGDRAGIVRALLGKHYPEIDRRRHQLLDAYEAEGRCDVRELSEALVLPAASKLSDPDGGPEYLQVSAELLNRPSGAREPDLSEGPLSSIDRWRMLVEPFLEQDAARLHRRFTAIRFAALELGRRAQSAPHRDDRLFVSQLVDLVAALLLAPVSPQTAVLAQARDRRQGSVAPAG
jgi:AcrR family transcriptional regulator